MAYLPWGRRFHQMKAIFMPGHTPFMKFSFGFTAILVYFRFFWLKSRWRRIRGWKEVSETYLISLGVKVFIIWQQFYWQATQALHRVLVWFHGHSGVFSNFSDRIRDVIVSQREKMFPGHILSPWGLSSHQMQATLILNQSPSSWKVSLGFMQSPVYFRFLWHHSCWYFSRVRKGVIGRELSFPEAIVIFTAVVCYCHYRKRSDIHTETAVKAS